MSITIIECKVDSIILSSFIKKGSTLVIEYQSSKALAYTQNAICDWIKEASEVIRELVTDAKVLFPAVLLLPGFALLTKVIDVPRVVSSRQMEITQVHINNILGTGNEEYLAYDIVDLKKFELKIVCVLIKKAWIESFCKALELIDSEIISIEPPAIHYYNYKEKFSKSDVPTLFIVIENSTACCLFISKYIRSISQIQINESSLFDEIKRLIALYNVKYPDSKIQELVISGKNEDNEKFIDAFGICIGLPTHVFLPLTIGSLHSIGSTGAGYSKFFSEGLSINLIPPQIKRIWNFNRNKKAIVIAGVCIAASLFILLNNINSKKNYYDEKIKAFEAKILPLRTLSNAIDRNEKTIVLYNEGLGALESYIKSNNSWVHFLNSLQISFMAVPNALIHSLKVEYDDQDCWKDVFMEVQDTDELLGRLSVIQINGSFLMNADQVTSDAIEKIRLLMLDLLKLEFVSEAKNLHFNTEHLPGVSFSLSLALKPQKPQIF